MNKIYLDHAATTYLYPEVIDELLAVATHEFGNPSSTYALGRSAKVILENSRKKIASYLNASSQEIIFTSGGTEANNWVIQNAVQKLEVKRIISTRTEHHAVLYPVLEVQNTTDTEVVFLKVSPQGNIDIQELEKLLEEKVPTLVSLMHVNNETGVIHDIQLIGDLCKKFEAYFHTDTVQSMGKTHFNLQKIPVDFMTASAHKFHGPKGVGFLFVRKNVAMQSLFLGGEQEKGLRAGTEALHQIAAMTKALEMSYTFLDENRNKIENLRSATIQLFDKHMSGFKINGSVDGFYPILNIQLPLPEEKTNMLLFALDLKGIAVSRGSACQSGSSKPSHVLAEMLSDDELKKPSIRISFDASNTVEEIIFLIEALKTI
ncbi:MAG: cysteine desulfurase family protein [Flavobacterium sp.]